MTAFNTVTPDNSSELVTIGKNQDMIELITIKQNGKVSARNLYKFLGLRHSDIARWLDSKIVNNEFTIENEDWWGFSIIAEGNNLKDYDLTPNFAKKLCMMSKSPKGEQAREYFLNCEKLAITKPKTTLEMLKEAVIELEAKDKQINILQENLDHSLDYVSILKVAMHNKISENSFNWRLLKAKSIELDYPVKKVISARYGYQNLYLVIVFKRVYPSYNYSFEKILSIA
jgi:phage anti-repressor protein